MNLILLNSVHKPTSPTSNKKCFKRFDPKVLSKHVKQIEQRKIDNFKQSVSFFKEMASQDAKFFQSMHDNIIKEFENTDITSIVQFNQNDDDGIFDN